MPGLQTEFDFQLPKGYVDRDGNLHRNGTMRLANARDELEASRDPRVRENDSYMTVVVLSRVITSLGSIGRPASDVIESLFVADLAFVQEFYSIVNFGDPADLEKLQAGGDPLSQA